MKISNIQWCDGTWSPWLGCSKVSPGCKNCYIVTTTPFRTRHLKHGDPRQRTSVSYWKQALQWNKKAIVCDHCGTAFNIEQAHMCVDNIRAGSDLSWHRMRVFPSLCDWLDDEVPIEWLADFLKLIHDTPNIDWLLLTKRPENCRYRIASAMEYLDRDIPRATATEEAELLRWLNSVNAEKPEPIKQLFAKLTRTPTALWLGDWLGENAPANVCIGTSVEDQKRADERIPELLKIPAKVRFLSVEPMLEAIEFSDVTHRSDAVSMLGKKALAGIDWVIFGGESGANARPCNAEWIRSGVKQCQAAGVKVFVKQLGAKPIFEPVYANVLGRTSRCEVVIRDKKGGDMSEWPEDLRIREFPV